jgi:hypothetical protein
MVGNQFSPRARREDLVGHGVSGRHGDGEKRAQDRGRPRQRDLEEAATHSDEDTNDDSADNLCDHVALLGL